MALRALQASVPSLQRIRRGRVFLDGEFRRLPPIDRVTGCALSTIRALCELAIVRIRLVTVHALGEYQRFFEVAVGMALSAINAGVLALQRKFCLRVIEALVDRLQRNLFPAAGVVT